MAIRGYLTGIVLGFAHTMGVLGITLLDHVILGEDRHFSFADHGWPAI